MKRKIWIWLLCALLLVYFLSALLTRCSREQADFFSVIVVTTTTEETPAEKLDTWLAHSFPVRFWQYLATPADQRQAIENAYETEAGVTE